MTERVLKLIKECGLTDKQIAVESGIGHGKITEWRKGRNKPGTEAIVKLADYFGVTTDYLLGRTGEKGDEDNDVGFNDGFGTDCEKVNVFQQKIDNFFVKADEISEQKKDPKRDLEAVLRRMGVSDRNNLNMLLNHVDLAVKYEHNKKLVGDALLRA